MMTPTSIFSRSRKSRNLNDLEWVVTMRSASGSLIEHKTFNNEQDARSFAAEHGYQEPDEPERNPRAEGILEGAVQVLASSGYTRDEILELVAQSLEEDA